VSTFERKYSDDEKEAALFAYMDRRIRPLRAVLELGSRGELITRDGRTVRPFQLNPHTLKTWITVEKRKRSGKLRGAAFEKPDDTIEALRRRLINTADSELSYVERQRTGKRDPEHLRQIARLVREVAALPKPGEGRSKAPGQRENGHKDSGETTGGLAGSLLAAHRRTPAQEQPSQTQTQTENTDASNTTRSTDAQQDTEHDAPGSPQRALIQRSNAG
jgi:hypothetical protein